MPLALLEAMTAGLPVVASEVVGNVDLVSQDDTGYLYPPGELLTAARLLARLARDPQLRCRLGARARQRVQSEFTVERFAAAYSEIYRELASRRGGQLTEVPAP
jgi:glycosyltransferase involved in cell wall biosynthesis